MKGVAMKLLHAQIQRSPNVGNIGWFTGVLKPNRWFAASRTAYTLHHPPSQVTGALFPKDALDHPQSYAATSPTLAVNLEQQDRSPVQIALVALVAIAVTSSLLWWICIPR
jgi:hypothetical protein